MSDISMPLERPPAKAVTGKGSGEAAEDGFVWPTPSFAAYPMAQPQRGPEACEILGQNNSRSSGQLIKIDMQGHSALIMVPPARNAIPIKFSQFRALKMMRVIPAAPRLAEDANSTLSLDNRPRTPFHVAFVAGGELKGITIGHHEDENGMFLFVPISEQNDSVRCVFIPKEAIDHADLGERIGDVLLREHAATPDDIESAAKEQNDIRSRRVGDILLAKQIVTAEQLLQAIDQQAKMPMVRIGEALLALELITQKQLEDALEQQKQDRSIPLGELLVRRGVVTRQQLQSALARKMGYPLVDIEHFPVEPDAVRKLPYSVAARLEVLPLVIRDGRLIVVMEDPTRRDALDEIEFITQLKVVPALTKVGTIQLILPGTYERFGADMLSPRDLALPGVSGTMELDNAGTLIETLEREQTERSTDRDEDKPIEQSDNSLVRLINTMIIEAYNQGVSDIHIETLPGREKLKIRFRRDGVMHPYLELPHTYRSALIARIKIMCDLDISERRKPQDGKINFSRFSAQHKLELRVATIPTNNGLEDVVMRLLASAKPIPMEKLGLSPDNKQRLEMAINRPYGMVLCVGPTGSGKTTTLHSVLGKINTPDRKIWTAEDPVEITQAGLRQVQVNPKIDWTFAKALRAFLRADPDVIMVGEIRDQETAQIAVEASLTGHLVLSTLHTNSAPETVTRLLDMGMDPFNFADSLLAVLAQRLVRRLCPSCRTQTPAGDQEIQEWLDDYLHVFGHEHRPNRAELLKRWIKDYGVDGQLQHYHSPGCAKCENTGYKGRAGLHELLTVSKDVRRLIQSGSRAEEIQHCALNEGMRTLRQDGIEKILQGITSTAEVRATSNA